MISLKLQIIYSMKIKIYYLLFYTFWNLSDGFSQVRPLWAISLESSTNTIQSNASVNFQRDFLLSPKVHLTVCNGIGISYHQGFLKTQILLGLGRDKNYFEIGVLGSNTYLKSIDMNLKGKYYLSPIIGYKLIPRQGFIGRIYLNPIVSQGNLTIFGGVSLGFYLRKKNHFLQKPTINSVRFSN
jgi:hypothetical protein